MCLDRKWAKIIVGLHSSTLSTNIKQGKEPPANTDKHVSPHRQIREMRQKHLLFLKRAHSLFFPVPFGAPRNFAYVRND